LVGIFTGLFPSAKQQLTALSNGTISSLLAHEKDPITDTTSKSLNSRVPKMLQNNLWPDGEVKSYYKGKLHLELIM